MVGEVCLECEMMLCIIVHCRFIYNGIQKYQCEKAEMGLDGSKLMFAEVSSAWPLILWCVPSACVPSKVSRCYCSLFSNLISRDTCMLADVSCEAAVVCSK